MKTRLALCLILLSQLAAFSGCKLIADWRWKDPVTGSWKGLWYVNGMSKAGGGLKCDVTRTGKDEWKATFDATFGDNAKALYKVELIGHRQGEKVAFGGDVDLGAASGGVFNWTGEADGVKFNGQYKSKMYGGHFEMDRVTNVTPAAAKKE